MKFILRSAISLLLTVSLGLAEDLQPTAPPQADFVGLIAKIEETWAGAIEHAAHRDFKSVQNDFLILQTLSLQAGLRSLDDFALYTAALGLDSLRRGDKEAAAFYARRVLELSPDRPLVLFKSAGLIDSAGVAPLGRQLRQALEETFRSPEELFFLLTQGIYALLFSISTGVLLLGLCLFAGHRETFFHRLSAQFPVLKRYRVVAHVLIAILVLSPVALGPAWCLALWPVLIVLFLPSLRWFAFVAGVSMVLWGVLVPIRENAASWLNSPGVQAMLRTERGGYKSKDLLELASFVETRPTDWVAWSVYAEELRRFGRLDAAEEALTRALLLSSDRGNILARKAVVVAQRGQPERAMKLFDQAAAEGMGGPAFLYNKSRVAFDLLDTNGSRELFSRAQAQAPGLVNLWSAEEEFGAKGPLGGYVPMPLGFKNLASSVLVPLPGTGTNSDHVWAIICPGLTIFEATAWGALLMLLCIASAKNYHRERLTLRPGLGAQKWPRILSVVPGGGLALREHRFLALLTSVTAVLLLMPIWPESLPQREFFILVPEAKSLYLIVVAALWLALTSIQYSALKGRR